MLKKIIMKVHKAVQSFPAKTLALRTTRGKVVTGKIYIDMVMNCSVIAGIEWLQFGNFDSQ